MSDALKGEAAPLKSLLCFDQERKKITSSYLPASLELDSQQQWLGSREWRQQADSLPQQEQDNHHQGEHTWCTERKQASNWEGGERAETAHVRYFFSSA